MSDPIAAAVVVALVVGISDGDTLTVRPDGREPIKVRIAEIDAPERRQPFGNWSREALAALCFRQRAEVQPVDVDRYGRTVAQVRCKGEDAGREQVRNGMAWVYDRYVTDRTLYELQDEARRGGLGLWVDPNAVPPWEWRRR